jgi:hypothetical protein
VRNVEKGDGKGNTLPRDQNSDLTDLDEDGGNGGTSRGHHPMFEPPSRLRGGRATPGTRLISSGETQPI